MKKSKEDGNLLINLCPQKYQDSYCVLHLETSSLFEPAKRCLKILSVDSAAVSVDGTPEDFVSVGEKNSGHLFK